SFPNRTGCLLISLSASHSNATYTISDLSALSKQPSYILFSTLYFVFIALLAFLSFGAVTPSLEPYRGLAIGLLSGCLSGNQTYIKGLSVIVSDYLKGVSVLKMPWTYFCLVMVGITAGGGIIALNAGLNSFEAMQIIPLYQGSFILIGSISGILFYHEMNGASVTTHTLRSP
ncbi:hypothetical protein WA577_001794, partial [Blastocystis sp. JDR]